MYNVYVFSKLTSVKQQLTKLFDPSTDSGIQYQKQFEQIYSFLVGQNIKKLCYRDQSIELDKVASLFILQDYSKLLLIYYKSYQTQIFFLKDKPLPDFNTFNVDKLVKELEKYDQTQEPISKLKFNQKQINTNQINQKYTEGSNFEIDFNNLLELEDVKKEDDIKIYLQKPINYMWKIYQLLLKNEDFLMDQVTYLHGWKFILRENSCDLQITNMIRLSLWMDNITFKAKFSKKENIWMTGNAFYENLEEIYKEVEIWTKTGISPSDQLRQQILQQPQQLQQLQQSVSQQQNKNIQEESQQKENEVLTKTDSDKNGISQSPLIIQEYKMENQQKQKLILNTQEQQEQQTILEQLQQNKQEQQQLQQPQQVQQQQQENKNKKIEIQSDIVNNNLEEIKQQKLTQNNTSERSESNTESKQDSLQEEKNQIIAEQQQQQIQQQQQNNQEQQSQQSQQQNNNNKNNNNQATTTVNNQITKPNNEQEKLQQQQQKNQQQKKQKQKDFRKKLGIVFLVMLMVCGLYVLVKYNKIILKKIIM